jgi:ATP-dependent helicase/nuclease subunit B
MDAKSPRVFTIPAGTPFLPTLADAVLSGRLAPLPRGDPLALADVTILLPTRRSVRALREVFEKTGGQATILPVIRPIGDIDEEDYLLNPEIEVGADRFLLPPAISALSQRLALTRLTLAWGRAVRRDLLQITPGEDVLIPASASDALRLAGDLARLLTDMYLAGLPWEKLTNLVPEDHSRYYQITLDFLKIAAEAWPGYLAGKELADPAARRDQLIRTEAERLRGFGSRGPIVAAGSTGSIPATAALLKAISGLENGAVVLPGLDHSLDDEAWAAIGGPSSEPVDGHPQFAMKQLIEIIGILRADVISLARPARAIRVRSKIVSEALRPAETTENWAEFRAAETNPRAVNAALAGVDLVVARHEQEEALAIAIAIREAMETHGNVMVALATPDRNLARRVGIELSRWRLTIDDSAGQPLDRMPAGVFARLLAEAACSEGDPVKLLALLKHPFAAFGMRPDQCRRAARALELALFRGRRVLGGIAALPAALAEARSSVAEGAVGHPPWSRRRLRDWQWELATTLAESLERVIGPIEARLRSGVDVSIADATALLVAALNGAAADESGRVDLWSSPDRVELEGLLTGLAEDEAKALAIDPSHYADFLAVLMSDVMVQRPVGADPRIHIWGTLEARLQSVDLLILGGLDEGVWPAETRTDPWLSRAMRSEIGLPPPERRIGLAAHDFAAGVAAPRVILTRAGKREGAPTVPSRWLQRLTALLGEDATAAMTARGERYIAIARDIDKVVAQKVQPARRPKPTPPVAARPRSLSITEIETLVRDPYAIYARRVLKLEELEPLGRAPDYALRGSLMHGALGVFTEGWQGPYDETALARLLETGKTTLAEIGDFPDIHAIWAIRFQAMARWFIDWEARRAGVVGKRHAEISGEVEIPAPAGPFKLRGRADRIDLMGDGTLAIYDFKTGTVPSAKQVLTGFSPQLGLEAAMTRLGAFDEDFRDRPVSMLAWIGLSRAARQGSDTVRSATDRLTPDVVGEKVLAEFSALIAAFDDEHRPYLSRARPMFETRYGSPYDHLARVREWTLVESEEDLFWALGVPAP